MIKWTRGFICGVFGSISVISIAMMAFYIEILMGLNKPSEKSRKYSYSSYYSK